MRDKMRRQCHTGCKVHWIKELECDWECAWIPSVVDPCSCLVISELNFQCQTGACFVLEIMCEVPTKCLIFLPYVFYNQRSKRSPRRTDIISAHGPQAESLDHTYRTQRLDALPQFFNIRLTLAHTDIHTTSVNYIHTHYKDAASVKTAD